MTDHPLACIQDSVHLNTEVTDIDQTAAQLQTIFNQAQQELPFCEGTTFNGMLSFAENLEEPIHRWYYYKEGYSHRLVAEVLKRYQIPSKYPAILDPFCGAGTTLVAAQSHGLSAVGIEINPFSFFISNVKTSLSKINPEELEKAFKKVITNNYHTHSLLPDLTTFHNEKYFPNNHAYELIKLRDAIRRCRTTTEVKNALLLALAATLDDVSCLRKDGRALRYQPYNVIHPTEALHRRAMVMIEDLKAIADRPYQDVTVLKGDARNLSSLLTNDLQPNQFGLIMYSPPYPNNFDYSEIYKCELWLLGMIDSYEQWKQLRLSTFRSHPSCNFPLTNYLKENPELREVYLLVEKAARCSDIGGTYAYKRAPNVIRGYFDDVFSMLKEQIVKLAPGGHIVCVVGNSRHGRLYIPTDIIIAQIGKAIGLELVEIYVAKHRNDRKHKNQILRESLVVFTKS
ncbi:DNA methyltransferase [Microcoleus sp. C2C3]|uniref:DNA methyltransferase n=1 Tax=unclassified Microcoleus TaxID=2642155 RepID=UPI002FCEB364